MIEFEDQKILFSALIPGTRRGVFVRKLHGQRLWRVRLWKSYGLEGFFRHAVNAQKRTER